MKRLTLLLCLFLLTPPLAAGGEGAGKVYRVGVLAGDPAWDEYVWHRLAALTYGGAERRTIRFERRSAEGEERLPELARELVRLEVDVILAAGTRAARAARDATGTIPIVMVADADPVEAGLVASLARPGGNVTGVSTVVPELSGKRLELLTETVPGLSRVMVLWNPADPDAAASWRETQTAATRLGLTLESREVRDPAKLASTLDGAISEETGALVVIADPLTASHARHITAFARHHRLPAIYPYDVFVDPFWGHEGLMSYGPDPWRVAGRTVEYVEKILRGTTPGDLPVERSTTFHFILNLKTAEALGLTIPPAVLGRADTLIE